MSKPNTELVEYPTELSKLLWQIFDDFVDDPDDETPYHELKHRHTKKAQAKIEQLITQEKIKELENIKVERGGVVSYKGKQIIGFGDGIRCMHDRISDRIDTLKSELKDN